jgi:hypothetical protein
LQLECDGLLSNFAFKFNLRRYTKAAPAQRGLGQGEQGADEVPAAASFNPEDHAGPAIDVAFLSSGAAYFTHRDLIKGGLKARPSTRSPLFSRFVSRFFCHFVSRFLPFYRQY